MKQKKLLKLKQKTLQSLNQTEQLCAKPKGMGGIPTSQTYAKKEIGDAAKSGKSGRKGITYTFEDGKTIQHHPEGHKFKDGVEWNQNHWNNHQPAGTSGGTNNHYTAPNSIKKP